MRRIAASPSSSFSISPGPVSFAAVLLFTGLIAWSAGDTPAVTALRQRAEAGDLEAINSLGDAYARGEGVDQDDASARRFYRQAAERGHVQALYNLGVLAETGQGMRIDAAGAFRSYLKAAEQGYPPAQLKIGEMFANGTGTIRDDISAVMWFRKAAANGAVEAEYQLGLAYEQGRGVAKDRQQAQQWYRSAADRGYARAQFNLALLLESGLSGNSDVTAVADLYRAAAIQGFAAAQNNYGLMLAEGRGNVPANLVESYAWLSIAAEKGANVSARNLVAQKLTQEQLAAANERIVSLRAELASGVVSRAPVEPIISRVIEPAPEVKPAAAAPVITPVENAAPQGAPTPVAVANAAGDVDRITPLQAKLASAEKEISALRVEQKEWQASSSRLVIDFGDLLSNAAEVVKARSALLTAQQKISALNRSDSESVTADLKADPKRAAALADANREVDAARAQAATALTKWSEEVARAGLIANTQTAPVEFASTAKSPATTEGANDSAALEKTEVQLAAVQAELDQLSQRLKDSTSENEAIRRDQERLTKENSTLSEQLRTAAEALTLAKRNTSNQSDWTKERDAIQAELDQRTAKLADAERRVGELQQITQRANDTANYTRALATERAELVGRLQALSETNERLSAEQSRLQAQTTKLEQEKQSAADALIAAQKEAGSSHVATDERDSLEAKIKDLTSRLSATDQQLSEAKQATDKAREEAMIATRAAAKAAEETAAVDAERSRVAELTATVATLTREKGALQQQVNELAALRAQSGRVAELEAALSAAQRRAAELEPTSMQLSAAQRELLSSKTESARLVVRVQALEADRNNQVNQLRQENAAITARLRQAQATLDQIASAARVSSGAPVIPPASVPTRATVSGANPVAVVLAANPTRIHTVAEGESLTRISVRYYGTGNRWTEIYAANRDVLRGQNTLRVGQQLTVP